ncbi:hypothetical protein EHQ12_03690 [Leptospira gomenensis]|uniref:Uncharacterized protein n=1 Tax=Leptospira gomenensis TaxID=2484974 RepID=A0A5F1Y990_9LEPT|nr:hypothetical protein [Leptospira gomenensis]TGK31686.1 hypothetical protein EHQ17_12945 [Leptospira gomenensis]TGK41685.1 hypothetical protein EHQ07_16525 [Leptospira gomenensis]TGK43361.1 hypothetical protein EHQ12_03690 [Leptospira gomenensis]TGK61355.1 hypothetical protein EHQ13_08340 [Leptospira gomenensis]
MKQQIKEGCRIYARTLGLGLVSLIVILATIDCRTNKKESKELTDLLTWMSLVGGSNLKTRIIDSNLSSGIGASNASSLINPHTGQLVSNSLLQGIYFGELEVVAYDYRPGETDQIHNGMSGFVGPDWSYWVIAPSGYTAGRYNVLKVGDQINPDWYPPMYRQKITTDFEIDAFEINMDRVGIVYDDAFYGIHDYPAGIDGGTSETNILYKYPEWSKIPKHTCIPEFPGVPSSPIANTANVLFVRKDIVTTPVVVTTNYTVSPVDGSLISSIKYSSRTLTTEESEFLLSLVQQGTTRRSYDNLLVIPYEGPWKITQDGESDTANKIYSAKDAEILVKFDLSNALDTNPAETDLSVPKIRFASDGQNVPLGLKLEIVSK